MDDEPKAEVITPPDTLKKKVKTGGPGAVDGGTLERAEAVIADMTDNYVEWAAKDLAKIYQALDNLKAEKKDRKDALALIFQLSHDMKGQGGSFGYTLMTILGGTLCNFVEKLEDAGSVEIEVIQLHINAMALVIAKQMKGDGGKEGVQLLKGLGLVAAKVSKE
ncbi:MAG: phosphorelay protein [Proteobacteria bacterium]|nr:phosphorelay protein [Pseudomonadota bacterium]MCH8214872.1 phosphorelay protein [Pseudomonadota bacterium]